MPKRSQVSDLAPVIASGEAYREVKEW